MQPEKPSFLKDALDTGWFGSIGPISVDYFRSELTAFRDVMCSTAYTLRQKNLAFRAIGLQAMNLDPKDPQVGMAEAWWYATVDEWMRRMAFEKPSSEEV